MENKEKESPYIYKMELHESISVGSDLIITRVPGGWIYTRIIMGLGSSTFVEFNNEFMKRGRHYSESIQ